MQRWREHGIDQRRSAATPIFPRQVRVTILPMCSKTIGQRVLADKRDVGARNHARAARAFARIAISIAERIKLLDVTELESALLGDSFAHAALKREMRFQIERAARQRVGAIRIAHAEHARSLHSYGDDDGVETQQNGFGHGVRIMVSARATQRRKRHRRHVSLPMRHGAS